jgi:hypothetical protein
VVVASVSSTTPRSRPAQTLAVSSEIREMPAARRVGEIWLSALAVGVGLAP